VVFGINNEQCQEFNEENKESLLNSFNKPGREYDTIEFRISSITEEKYKDFLNNCI